MSQPDEVFPVEFKHETVSKAVKGMVDGTISVDWESIMFKGLHGQRNLDTVTNHWASLLACVTQYCSGKYEGKTLADLEQKLFEDVAFLRACSVLKEAYTPSRAEEDIKKLNERMDSTNNLLLEVLKVNKTILEILENIAKD